MTTFYWHIHHDVLVEPVVGSIAKRRAFIREYKPKKEVALRLRLLHKAVGLPESYRKARADYDKAGAARNKARADYDEACYDEAWADDDKAWADYDKAWADYDKAGADWDKARADSLVKITALHAAQCPYCPWDGYTIFPRSVEDVSHAN